MFSRVRVNCDNGLGGETLTRWQWTVAKEMKALSHVFRWALFYFLKFLD